MNTAPRYACLRAKIHIASGLVRLSLEAVRPAWQPWMDLLLIAHGRRRDALQSLHVGLS